MSDPETLGVYAQQADKYARMTHDANTADPILHAFAQCLPEGGHVLDLGCGPGDSAAKMAANGFASPQLTPLLRWLNWPANTMVSQQNKRPLTTLAAPISTMASGPISACCMHQNPTCRATLQR